MSRSLTALVTGASRGIGRAIAQQLAARGCRVAVHFNANRPAADATLHSLAGAGHALFSADLSSADNIGRLWRDVTVALGAIDIVVNNAGIYAEHPPLATGFTEWQTAWQQTFAINLFGPANLCHLAAQAMASRPTPAPDANAFGRGRIVNISSRGAFRGEPEGPAYGASKAGINSLSQSLAKALAPQGIYVFCLAPGWVETEMAADHLASPGGAEILAQHPLGRIASPEEIARTATFCALDAPAAMTGSIIDVNGASYLRT
jgi:3-oxoacyl-[acyl-carrier protein] reductase